MRPVSAEFRTSQDFGSGATAGIAPNPNRNSGMGYYVHLYGNYQPHGHAGEDIACPVGTPIYAPADGTVLYAGWTEDLPGTGDVRKYLLYWNFGGIVTVIQHNGWKSIIAHQSNNDAVHVGMKVKEGQLIGKSGDTKTRHTKVAPHVHVEALVYDDYRTNVRNGVIYGRVDPTTYFGGLAAQGTITQEDEVVTKAEMLEIAGYVWNFDYKTNDGRDAKPLWLLQSIDAIIKETIAKTAQATAQVLLSTELPNVMTGGTTTLGTQVSWMPQDFKAVRDAVTNAEVSGAAPSIDPAEVARLVSEGIQKATDGLSITLSAGGKQ